MEDDNGLDLTLSLPCGGPSGGPKGKSSSSSEVRVEEADRGNKLIDDFKNFLDGSNHKEESTIASQRTNQSKPDENLFYDLSKGTPNSDPWGQKDGRSSEVVEERRQEANNKRKNMFDEINHQKRNEREAYLSGLHKSRTQPHVSITTDEGSMAENEDVADSEADGSTSKRQSEGSKEVRGPSESNVDLQSQRRFTISSDNKDYKVGHVSHGVPFSGQSANILNMPYSLSVKESNSMPVMTSTQQPVIPANLPLMFNYSSVPVPATEAGKSEGLVSYFGRGPPNTSKQNDGLKITQGATSANAVKQFERAKGEGKHGKEEGPSMHTEGDTKGINGIDQGRVAEGIPPEYPAIRPGISAELKFGGSGSSPNLPWVSTTAPGPNGKTISGVTYRYTGTQIRIVCACHGTHMSPDEFVQHATDQPPNGGSGGGGLPAFPNPAASAQN